MSNIIDLKTDNSISLIHFELQTPSVNLGEDLVFSFTLQNTSDAPIRLNIRYEIDCPDGKGGWRRHSYKISNRKCPVGFLLYNRNHTILEDSVSKAAELPAHTSQESAPTDSPSVLLFSGNPETDSLRLPCRLHILINGQVLRTEGFELCL